MTKEIYIRIVDETKNISMKAKSQCEDCLECFDKMEMPKTLKETEEVLKNCNIDLKTTEGNHKSFGDVLDEVAKHWSVCSDVDKISIAKAFGGLKGIEDFRIFFDCASK